MSGRRESREHVSVGGGRLTGYAAMPEISGIGGNHRPRRRVLRASRLVPPTGRAWLWDGELADERAASLDPPADPSRRGSLIQLASDEKMLR